MPAARHQFAPHVLTPDVVHRWVRGLQDPYGLSRVNHDGTGVPDHDPPAGRLNPGWTRVVPHRFDHAAHRSAVGAPLLLPTIRTRRAATPPSRRSRVIPLIPSVGRR